jgi:CDP-diacylglycerol pyrophosphatase
MSQLIAPLFVYLFTDSLSSNKSSDKIHAFYHIECASSSSDTRREIKNLKLPNERWIRLREVLKIDSIVASHVEERELFALNRLTRLSKLISPVCNPAGRYVLFNTFAYIDSPY